VVGAGAGVGAAVAAAVIGGRDELENDVLPASPPPTTASSVRRSLTWVVGLGLLFAGFYADLLQAILVIGTLIFTIPVLSAVLPGIAAPSWLRERSLVGRFVVAAIATGLLGWGMAAVLTGVPDLQTQLAGPIIIAITAPVFRIIVDLGRVAPAPNTPSAASTVVTTVLSLLVLAVLWVALPALALAGNCPPDHPVRDCHQRNQSALPGVAMGAGAAIAGAAGVASSKKPPPGPPPGQDKYTKRPNQPSPKQPPKEPPKDEEQPDRPWWDPRSYF